MSILIGVLGLLAVIGLAFLLSNKKKEVNFKAVGIMIGLQLVTAWFMLGTKVGLTIIEFISTMFTKMLSYGYEGINFVVGGWIPEGGSPFFINVLLIIIFTSTLLSVLTHYKILPIAIKYVGGLLSKVTGLPKVESFNAVNSIFFGQSEALLAVKNNIPKLDKNRLFIVSTSAMASVSASIVGSYMQMIPAKYVLVAMVLNMFSALIVASIMTPVKKSDTDEEVNVKDLVTTKNVFEAISQGALDGGKVVLIVAAMLVAYISMLALINGVMAGTIGIDLTTILSYVLAPVAFLMGIPASEILVAGEIMGTKIVANEFVAILQFQPLIDSLSTKAVGIISTFLISFAAFGSIGIIAGSMQAIHSGKAKEVSAFGLKMLLAATMSSVISATIVGFFL